MAVVMEKLPVLIDLCFRRLLFPIRLSTRGETAYQGYIRSHLEEIVPYLIKNEQTEGIRLISGAKTVDTRGAGPGDRVRFRQAEAGDFKSAYE